MEIMAILNVHISGQERVVKCGKALVPSPLPVCSVTESRGTLGDPMDCSPPDSSVHGILQARILEWSGRFLLQGIFQTQGSNPRFLCLLNWQADSSLLASPGKPLSACYASNTSAWNMMFTTGFGASLVAQLIKNLPAMRETLVHLLGLPESGRSSGEGIGYLLQCSWVSLLAQMVKNLPAIQETWVRSQGSWRARHRFFNYRIFASDFLNHV